MEGRKGGAVSTNPCVFYPSNGHSTQSLPALLRGRHNENVIRKFQSLSTLANPPQVSQRFSPSENESIDKVCDFVNNNSEQNLLELPGLKVKQNKIKLQQKLKPKMDGFTVNINLINGDILNIIVEVRTTTIKELLENTLKKSGIDSKYNDVFCLAVKSGEEYFVLPSTDTVADHTTGTMNTLNLYTRYLIPPTNNIRKMFLPGIFDLQNCGNFSYLGQVNKMEGSAGVEVVINHAGVQINQEHLPWRSINQVSYSHTFLQILYLNKNKLIKRKICFKNRNIKLIHDLIIKFINRAKLNETIQSRQTKPPEPCKFEALCQRICTATREAVRSLSTPRRKRSKSIDTTSQQRPKKVLVKRSSSSADTNKVKRNIMFDLDEPQKNIPLHFPVKRKSTSELENMPKRSKIVTNPQPAPGYQKPKQNLPNTRTPVRMGTRTLLQSNSSQLEKKIVCITLSRAEYLSLNLVLRRRYEGVFIESTEHATTCKVFPGDRVVAVNGTSLEGCSLERAYFLFNSSQHLVNIIVSRVQI